MIFFPSWLVAFWLLMCPFCLNSFLLCISLTILPPISLYLSPVSLFLPLSSFFSDIFPFFSSPYFSPQWHWPIFPLPHPPRPGWLLRCLDRLWWLNCWTEPVALQTAGQRIDSSDLFVFTETRSCTVLQLFCPMRSILIIQYVHFTFAIHVRLVVNFAPLILHLRRHWGHGSCEMVDELHTVGAYCICRSVTTWTVLWQVCARLPVYIDI